MLVTLLMKDLIKVYDENTRPASSSPSPCNSGDLASEPSNDSYDLPQTAASPRSSVRIRTISSRGSTKTLPSPIFPVFAAFTIRSTV
jgi:hypothetical protein